jgi:class 3 adenylate cyclase
VDKNVQRRLAAILAADVVGYSRLMEADETGTLAALKTLRRELIDPRMATYRGRVVKLMAILQVPLRSLLPTRSARGLW